MCDIIYLELEFRSGLQRIGRVGYVKAVQTISYDNTAGNPSQSAV